MINILKHIEELRPFLREMIIKEDLAMVNGLFLRCKDVKCKECEFYNSIIFANDIEKEVGIPLIHIVKSAAEAIKNKYPKANKIGLIATTGTIKSGVYANILKDYGYDIIELDEKLENNIMDCIYKGVKAGKTEEYVTLFQECVDKITDKGADVLIAGCTEVPLFIPHLKLKVPIIDSTLELALAAVNFALPK